MQEIQWFPGHMTKAMRMMEENIRLTDGVLMVLDARAPAATFNKKLKKLCGNKPVLYILNKADLSDRSRTDAFVAEISADAQVMLCSANAKGAAQRISGKIAVLLKAKTEKDAAKGMTRVPRLMVAGIPNTGKSTIINALSGEKRAATGNRAGVTRGKQWIRCAGFELLDTPGTMPPAFENQILARHLAYIGSIRDEILNREEIALCLLGEIGREYPQYLAERYGAEEGMSAEEIFSSVCRRRGFLLRGGEPDRERAAAAVLDDFRKGRIGAVTLEKAADYAGFFRGE